jgi:hypothetical protein
MTGYMIAMGACISCERFFAFNPERVPSTTAITGEREPVCRDCMDRINSNRRDRGLPEFPILPGAYDPEPEEPTEEER